MEKRLYRQPGFEVEVVDTIGCGDAFLGALLAALLGGGEPALALERACAAAPSSPATPAEILNFARSTSARYWPADDDESAAGRPFVPLHRAR